MAQLINNMSGTMEDVPQENIMPSLQANTHSLPVGQDVPMIHQDGSMANIAPHDIKQAMNEGYSIPTSPQLLEAQNQVKYGEGLANEAIAGIAGGAEMATLGASNVLARGVMSKTAFDAYNQILDRNPGARLAGGAVGIYLDPFAAAAGVARVAKAAETATEAVLAAKASSSPAIQGILKLAPKVIGSAVEGAIYGGDQAVNEQVLGDTRTLGEALVANSLMGAGIGASFPILGAGLKFGAKNISETVGNTYKKLLGDGIGSDGIFGKAVDKIASSLGLSKEGDWLATLKVRDMPDGVLNTIKSEIKKVGDEMVVHYDEQLDKYKATLKEAPVEDYVNSAKFVDGMVSETARDLRDMKGATGKVGAAAANLEKLSSELQNDIPKIKSSEKLFERLSSVADATKKLATEFKGTPDIAEHLVKLSDNIIADLHDVGVQSLPQQQATLKTVKFDDYSSRIEIQSNGKKVGEMLLERNQDTNAMKIGSINIKPEFTARGLAKSAIRQAAEQYGQLEIPSTISKYSEGLFKSMQAEGHIAPGSLLDAIAAGKAAGIGEKTGVNQWQNAARPSVKVASLRQAFYDSWSELQAALKDKELSLGNLREKLESNQKFGDLFSKHLNLDASQATNIPNKDFIDTFERVKSLADTKAASEANFGFGAGAGKQMLALTGFNTGHPVFAAAAGVAAGLQNPYKIAKVLAGLEKTGNLAKQTLEKATTAIFNSKIVGQTKIVAEVMTIRDLNDDRKHLANTSDPQAMMDQMANATVHIHEIAPNTSQSAQNTLLRAHQFLQTKLPSNQTDLFGNERIPTQAEINKFYKYKTLVENPMSAMEHIKNGTITPEVMETLHAVYPDMYHQMQLSVAHNLADVGSKKLPYVVKQSIQAFLGMPLKSSGVILTPTQQPPQGGGVKAPNLGAMKNMDIAGRVGLTSGRQGIK